MTHIVTGGSGFIGSYLSKALKERGEEVVRFDIKPPEEDIEGTEAVQGDLTAWTDVMEVVSKHDVENIYHVGALLSSSSEKDPQLSFRTNVIGTFNVLEACRLFDVDKCIFSSTIGVYGPGIKEEATEDLPQRPSPSMYGTCKSVAERLGEYYQERLDVNFRGARLSTVLGPGQGTGATSAYAPLMIEEPAKGNPYTVFVKERTTESVIYVKDVVRGLIELAQAPEDRLSTRIYNLGGLRTSARELADAVINQIPSANISFDPDPEAQSVRDMTPDKISNSLATDDWDWELQYDNQEEIVEAFIEEVQDEA